jgi:signal transduction histidine kinase
MQHSRFVVLIVSILMIFGIGVVDYITGPELAFSIFYLIPISFLASQQKVTMKMIILVSFFASATWFSIEFYSQAYSLLFFPIWNGFVRLTIFLVVGYLVYNYRLKANNLKEINLQLERLNQEKNKFIGIAAHDLRSPLAGIHGLTEILLMEKSRLSQDQLDVGNNIIRLSQNMLTLIKNLLSISSIESGILNVDLQHRKYFPFVQEQVFLYEIMAKKKNIHISLKNDIHDIEARFDPNYMSQALGNLLSNAIKYSPRNSTITLLIYSTQQDIVTEVSDQGAGITKEDQRKLFNYFQRVSNQPTNGESSTGLGLAIAKKIVAVHGGTIGVRSAPGSGSCFYYTLPLMSSPS